MNTTVRHESGRYVYAIIDAEAQKTWNATGVNGRPVYLVPQGPIAAVVSDIAERRIRPERRNLVAHHAVVKRVMEAVTMLPVAFGTIAGGQKAVLKILKDHGGSFVAQLDHVRGRVEMGLRVSWDVPNIFEYFVTHHVDLADMRDSVHEQPRGGARKDKIELGRLFNHLLAEDREQHVEAVMKVLRSSCEEITSNPPRNEREVMHLACLVARDSKVRFENAVFEAAKRFDNNFKFDFNGPWAPHHFCDVVVDV
jgi:hypothetical protein